MVKFLPRLSTELYEVCRQILGKEPLPFVEYYRLFSRIFLCYYFPFSFLFSFHFYYLLSCINRCIDMYCNSMNTKNPFSSHDIRAIKRLPIKKKKKTSKP